LGILFLIQSNYGRARAAGALIGKFWDESDKLAHEKAWNKTETCPLNQPVNWNNLLIGHEAGTPAPLPIRAAFMLIENQRIGNREP